MGDQLYISTKKASEMLGVTDRRIVGLCQNGELEGAFKEGRTWKIPNTSVIKFAEKNNRPIHKLDRKYLLPCAIGITSYVELVSECYYVDKTLLIRDLIDDHNSVTLFTRPRRFGKTLTMNMLKTYFEKTETDTSIYFKDKKIWQCGEKYQAQQGSYPVIMLTFKDIKYNSWQDSMEAIRLVLKDEFKRHRYLLNWENLSPDDKDYLNRMESNSLTDVEYTRSLLTLCRLLAGYHHSKVIILIDEYDTPIQQGYSHGFYDNVIGFMRPLFSGGLKDNLDLAFGVLTGIMRISKENLFSGLNNLTVNTVLDEKYNEYFGFTDREISEMASYYETADKNSEIRKWYDGYNFGGRDIYNPWSVTNYFASNCKAKAYWVNTSDNEIIRQIMKNLTPAVAEDLASVMQDRQILTSLDLEVIYPKITDGVNTIFSFLLLAGYLTPDSNPEETELGTMISLRLPNMEIRRVYSTEILSWMRETKVGNAASEIEKAFYLRNGDRLKKALEDYMITCISSYDGAVEGFYHGMMLGLVAILSSCYYIRSNRESGDGRFDLQLEPKTNMDPGILMEFKIAKSSDKDKLLYLANEALQQISEKQYDVEMKDRGITDISKYGIAFAGKHAEVIKS